MQYCSSKKAFQVRLEVMTAHLASSSVAGYAVRLDLMSHRAFCSVSPRQRKAIYLDDYMRLQFNEVDKYIRKMCNAL